MKKTSLPALLCAATLATAALTGCGSAEQPAAKPTTAPSPTEKDSGTVAWSPCTDLTGPDGKPAAPDPAVECGKIAVPLDYAKQDGEKIDLALIRVKATGDRLGSLVFNFGGPGGSGVDLLALTARAFGGLGSRYDLVSFDPRGVERSAPVKCGDSVEKWTSADPASDEVNKIAKEFEYHAKRDHVFQVLAGETKYELGGTPKTPRETKPGEFLAPESEGHKTVMLKQGDYLFVPRMTPHRRITDGSVSLLLISAE